MISEIFDRLLYLSALYYMSNFFPFISALFSTILFHILILCVSLPFLLSMIVLCVSPLSHAHILTHNIKYRLKFYVETKQI